MFVWVLGFVNILGLESDFLYGLSVMYVFTFSLIFYLFCPKLYWFIFFITPVLKVSGT